MGGELEAPVGRPAVALEHAGEVLAQDHLGVVVPAPGGDQVHGRVLARERPQPCLAAVDPPARLIRSHDRALSDALDQRQVGRLEPSCLARDRSHDPTRRDLDPGDKRKRASGLLRREPQLLVQAADLEGGDDAHRAVVAAAVPVRVAMRADAECGLAGRAVSRDECPHRILGDLEADRFELPPEVVERVPVDVRVGVAADRLLRERVLRAGQRLDVALDPVGAGVTLDRDHARRH